MNEHLQKAFLSETSLSIWITYSPKLLLIWSLQIVLASTTVFQTEISVRISCISIWDPPALLAVLALPGSQATLTSTSERERLPALPESGAERG